MPGVEPRTVGGPGRDVVRVAVAFYAALALLAVAVIAWRAGAAGLRERLVGAQPVHGLALGIAVGLATVLATRVLVVVSPRFARLEVALGRLMGRLSLGGCAALALSSGIGEELLFRAALQPEVGLLAASVLFGALHVPLERALWPWPAFAFAMGLLLGVLFRETGGVLAPAAAHAVVNLLNLRHATRSAAAEGDQGQPSPEAVAESGRSAPDDDRP